MGFFLGRSVVRMCLVGWGCTFPPLVEIGEHPEFHDLMEMD